MDYLQLASALVVIYASIIPLYLTGRMLGRNRRFFAISLMLGLGLLLHGLYHYWAFLGDGLLKVGFEFLSALLLFTLTLSYTYLRRRVTHGG